jgi:hypothetical protein
MGPSPDGITVDSIMRHWADEFGPDLSEKQLIDAAADGDAHEVLIPTEILRIILRAVFFALIPVFVFTLFVLSSWLLLSQ